MSNQTKNVENKKDFKHFFDKVSLTALKCEIVVMVCIIATCAFKVTTTFIL